MLPIIVVSRNETKINQFINEYIDENNINPHYIFRLKPLKQELSIEQIRDLKKTLNVTAVNQRLIILEAFDFASTEAQNALLKTLEENIVKNQFVLIAQNTTKILSTIRSRAKTIFLNRSQSEIKLTSEVKSLLEKVIKDKNFSFLSSPLIMSMTKEKATEFIDQIIYYFRNKFFELDNAQSVKIVKKSLFYRSFMQNNNLNSQLSIDTLLIFIHKTFNMKNNVKS